MFLHVSRYFKVSRHSFADPRKNTKRNRRYRQALIPAAIAKDRENLIVEWFSQKRDKYESQPDSGAIHFPYPSHTEVYLMSLRDNGYRSSAAWYRYRRLTSLKSKKRAVDSDYDTADDSEMDNMPAKPPFSLSLFKKVQLTPLSLSLSPCYCVCVSVFVCV